MAQDISQLFHSLESARKSTTVLDRFTVLEPSLTEQKELLKSVFDPMEAPARLSIAYDDIIRSCVTIENGYDKKIDIFDRIYLLREIRDLVMGNTFTKKNKDENSSSESDSSYTYLPINYDELSMIEKEKEISISKNIKVIVQVPSISRDSDVNRWLLEHLSSYRRNNNRVTEQALAAHATVQYLTFEIVKYIKEIHVDESVYQFEDMTQSEQIRAASQLPQTSINEIEDFFQQIKNAEKHVYSAMNDTTKETIVAVPDFNLFSKEI